MTEKDQGGKDEQAQLAAVYRSYLAKYANDLLILLDDSFHFLEVNERVVDSYGYTRDELIGMHVKQLRAPETRALVADQIKPAEVTGRALFETLHQRKNGTTFPVEISLHMIDIEGKRFFQAVIRDITERKKAEEDLRREKELAQAYLETAAVMMLVLGLDGKVTLINQRGCEILGCEKEDVIGMDWFDHFVPERRRAEARSIFRRIINKEEGLLGYVEDLIVTKNGHEKLIGWNNTVIRGRGKRVIEVLSSGEDITEWKNAETALAESEKKYRLLAESAYDWEYWVAPNRSVIYVSPSCERITGYLPEEFVRNPHLLAKIVSPRDRKIMTSHREAVERDNEKTCELEFRILSRSGKERWVYHACSPMRGENGVYLGRHVSNRDITERKKVEAETGRHLKDLEAFYKANQAREDRILELKQKLERLRNKQRSNHSSRPPP